MKLVSLALMCAFHLNKNILHLLMCCFLIVHSCFLCWFFFPFLKHTDFVESDSFCLFLPFLPLPHSSLEGHVCKSTMCRGDSLLSCLEGYFSAWRTISFCSFYVLEVRKGGNQKSSLFYCELDATKNYIFFQASPCFSNIPWKNSAQNQCY